MLQQVSDCQQSGFNKKPPTEVDGSTRTPGYRRPLGDDDDVQVESHQNTRLAGAAGLVKW
jgi:hypothetical protein